MNLTRMATTSKTINGKTFISDQKLKGGKYAVRYEGEKEIHVSPAVYDLIDSDFEAMLDNLTVRDVRRRRRRRPSENA